MYSLHLSLLHFYIMDDIIRNEVLFCFNVTLAFFYLYIYIYIMANNSMIRDLNQISCVTSVLLDVPHAMKIHKQDTTLTVLRSLAIICANQLLTFAAAILFCHSALASRDVFTTNSSYLPKQHLRSLFAADGFSSM